MLEQIYTLIYIRHHTTTTLEVTPFPLLNSGILELCLKTALLLGKTRYVFIITMTERNAFYISSSVHILFLLDTIGAYLEIIFLQQSVYFIIASLNVALNQSIMAIFAQLLNVWMALVSSWLIAKVNFMTVLGDNIPRMFSEEN